MERGASSHNLQSHSSYNVIAAQATPAGMETEEPVYPENLDPNGGSGDQQQEIRAQDQNMPIANVTRIMRRVLPANAKISDEAKETVQECVSEYISFITAEANQHCHREHRKTITAEDILYALSKLGFEDYVDPLILFINRYRQQETGRTSVRGKPLIKRAANSLPTPAEQVQEQVQFRPILPAPIAVAPVNVAMPFPLAANIPPGFFNFAGDGGISSNVSYGRNAAEEAAAAAALSGFNGGSGDQFRASSSNGGLALPGYNPWFGQF